MAALPYIQLYVADYLADTMHLTTEEHGAYLLLIMNYWQTGHPIPKRRLASVARLSNDRWTDVEKSLSEFFTETPTGEWYHARIEGDLAKVLSKSEQASAAGKASAAARANAQTRMNTDNSNGRSTVVASPLNHTDTDIDTDIDTEKPKSNSSAFAKKNFEAETQNSNPSSKPNQTQLDVGEVMPPTADVVDLQKTGKGRGTSRALGVDDLIADGIPRQYAEDWLRVRRAKKSPLTQTAWLAVKAEAVKAGITSSEAVKVSAVNSWQGFKAAWYENLKLSEAKPVKPGALPTNGTHGGYSGRNYGEGGLL